MMNALLPWGKDIGKLLRVLELFPKVGLLSNAWLENIGIEVCGGNVAVPVGSALLLFASFVVADPAIGCDVPSMLSGADGISALTGFEGPADSSEPPNLWHNMANGT